MLGAHTALSQVLFLYLNGYYEGTVSTQHALDLINLVADYPDLFLFQPDAEQILLFEPGLIADIEAFLDDHPNDPVAEQAVLDLIAAQMCETQNPCNHTDYPNDFKGIYDIYKGLTGEEKAWVSSLPSGLASAYFGDYDIYEEDDVPVIIVWILKKAAEASAGAIIDITVQYVMEYWFGGHDDWQEAWEALEINWWQVIQSSGEALISSKKYAVLVSAFGDLINYLLDEENPTLEGATGHFVFGGISAWLGTNAADNIDNIFKYFNKYDPDDVVLALADLKYKTYIFQYWRLSFYPH